ncbi:hypothetical protein ABZV78_01490 [Micromonospora sp. NPDC004540]|uniref:hypothetical protein n=1 Tax=Micromonospora sp. NPDC004540 TaxID=3154457 RepID=UPI0033ABF42B
MPDPETADDSRPLQSPAPTVRGELLTLLALLLASAVLLTLCLGCAALWLYN